MPRIKKKIAAEFVGHELLDQCQIPSTTLVSEAKAKKGLFKISDHFTSEAENVAACFYLGKLVADGRAAKKDRVQYNHFRKLLANPCYLKTQVRQFLSEHSFITGSTTAITAASTSSSSVPINTSNSLSILEQLREIYASEYRVIIFQNWFGDNLVDSDKVREEERLVTGNTSERKHIYLLRSEKGEGNLYELLLKPWVCFHFKYMCKKCFTFVQNLQHHNCDPSCSKCGSRQCKRTGAFVKCSRCLDYFYGFECYQLHQEQCTPAQLCAECGESITSKYFPRHKCGKVSCPHCQLIHPIGHCYIQKESSRAEKRKKRAKKHRGKETQGEGEEEEEEDDGDEWSEIGEESADEEEEGMQEEEEEE